MAQIPDSSCKKENHQPRRTSSCFLGCFGSSIPPHKVKEKSKKSSTSPTTTTRTTVSWFSWSKKSPKRTVPVDAATSEKLHQRKDGFLMAKSIKKVLAKPPNLPADGAVAGQAPGGTIGDGIVQGKKFAKSKYENAQKIILENSKSLNRLESIVEETTYKKGSSKKHSSSHRSPEDQHAVSQRAVAVISHSASIPPLSIQKKPAVGNGGEQSFLVKKDKSQGENDKQGGKFDRFVGMSIILVTLTIMVVWGKLCAILCTSAWLYCFPLIKAQKVEPKVTTRNGSKSFDLDINSEEYKKKVVLEGLLERNRRNNA
ncbi:unnamed protein product [Coffea canephora]|uniref:Uncharacterized protein n=2 Tax=Coffea TaxID=13442 RepID=A0A068UR28_COFCA|nr:uncharacterized protein At5g23160-like [Coffea arabica]CDP11010.1 unnamed protein product [Coffea canephora]